VRIGLILDSLSEMTLPQALDAAAELGVQAVEIPTGNWSSAPHVDLAELTSSAAARRSLADAVSSRGLTIENFNCSGNQFHPRHGAQHAKVIEDTIRLSSEFGLSKVVMMSGLPAAPGDSMPNWITSAWPPDIIPLLEHQWNEVAIPYWEKLVPIAGSCGVTRIALELHPQQLVYNVSSFRRLRAAVGDVVGVNMDPSHLMFMGADPLAAIDVLGDAVYHVHAKDTQITDKARYDSCYETLPSAAWRERSWNYVTLGRGHPDGASFWRRFVEHLHAAGYDGVLSIEHEDVALSQLEGVTQAVRLLQEVTA
jgi:sugar phosphate isomerase/epimerase